MSIKKPYKREDISSTLLALSATVALMLSSLILPVSSFLFQPVQASSITSSSKSSGDWSFQTPTPASGTSPTSGEKLSLMFDAKGITFGDPDHVKITNGSFQITTPDNGNIAYSGNIQNGNYTNILGEWPLYASGPIDQSGDTFVISTSCISGSPTDIDVTIHIRGGGGTLKFQGPVECLSPGGDTTSHTVQPRSSSMTGTTTTQSKDSDGDGKPDSSDKCPHNSEHRCFKEEGGTSSGTTNEQPSSSSPSSSSSGNQTR